MAVMLAVGIMPASALTDRQAQINRIEMLELQLAAEADLIGNGNDESDRLLVAARINIEDLLYYIHENRGAISGDWEGIKELIRDRYPEWGERISTLDPTYGFTSEGKDWESRGDIGRNKHKTHRHRADI